MTLLLLLVAIGCEEGREPSRPDVVVDAREPCAFATPAEIAAATGGSAGERDERPARGPGDVVLCHYDVGPPYSSVTLYVESPVSAEAFRRRMERDPLNTDPLDGYGELAFTHGGVGVSVWEGGRAVSASLQHFGDIDEARVALEGLAELMDAKL
jgi:hypothetical protein